MSLWDTLFSLTKEALPLALMVPSFIEALDEMFKASIMSAKLSTAREENVTICLGFLVEGNKVSFVTEMGCETAFSPSLDGVKPFVVALAGAVTGVVV